MAERKKHTFSKDYYLNSLNTAFQHLNRKIATVKEKTMIDEIKSPSIRIGSVGYFKDGFLSISYRKMIWNMFSDMRLDIPAEPIISQERSGTAYYTAIEFQIYDILEKKGFDKMIKDIYGESAREKRNFTMNAFNVISRLVNKINKSSRTVVSAYNIKKKNHILGIQLLKRNGEYEITMGAVNRYDASDTSLEKEGRKTAMYLDDLISKVQEG